MLAGACNGNMSLFAGLPRSGEGILVGKLQLADYVAAQNIHLFWGSFYFCYQKGLMDWLADWNPDALIVEANPRYLATASAVRWMHRRGRRVIGWGLGAPPLAGPLANFRRMRRIQFLKNFDALIAYSQRGADEYAALGFSRERIFVAPNAVASQPRTKLPRRPASFVRQPTILFVGRLQARKRIDFLLRACAEMSEPKPRLVIVGDGPERNSLQILARQVYPPAEFVGDKRGDELKAYFKKADLFVLPGTGGLAIQEAMTYGLPIIVAKGDGTQDDLVHTENGWQIPAEDYGALVETLRLALSDVKQLRKKGKESYRIVSEDINLEKMVQVFVNALNCLR